MKGYGLGREWWMGIDLTVRLITGNQFFHDVSDVFHVCQKDHIEHFRECPTICL